MLKLRDGTQLFLDINENNSSDWIIWVHGICEHSGRYSHLNKLFADKFNILKFDLRGHGKSGGPRVSINSFSDFVDDLDEVISYLKNNYNAPRFVLMGHSMGALIVSGYMQNKANKDYYPQGVFFNSPPVGMPGAAGLLAKVLPCGATKLLAGINIGANLKGLIALDALSHDPKIAKEYVADKLNSMVINSTLLFNMVNYGKEVFSKTLNITCPVFVAVGSKDTVVCPKTIINFCDKTDSTIQLKIINDAFHELHNESDEYRLPYFNYMKDKVLGFFP